MQDRELQDLLIQLLYFELCEKDIDLSLKQKLTSDVLNKLYDVSLKHDVAHIVSSALNKYNLSCAIPEGFGLEQIKSIYRCESMKYAYKQITDALESADIDYIPLKGAVIKNYYPKENLRTSCDIDILIKEKDIDLAVQYLEKTGYRVAERLYHDVSMYSPANVHLELHFNILENMKNIDAVLKDAWDYAECKDGNHYKFTDEFFLFHMFAHMYYHFIRGGCGIRSLIDIWLINSKLSIYPENIKVLLDKADIYKFACGISALASECFSNGKMSKQSKLLLSYIIKGGVYGSKSNTVAMNMSKSNRFAFAIKRLFLPYSKMKYGYPILKKFPVLLPLCYCHRLFSAVFGKKQKSARGEFRILGDLNDTEIENINLIREYLKL